MRFFRSPISARAPLVLLICAIVWLTAGNQARAQQSPVPDPTLANSVSSEQLEASIDAVEGREDLDDETRTRIIAELRQAQTEILAAGSAEVDAQAFAGAFETAPLETARLRADLDDNTTAPPEPADLGVREDTSLGGLERILAQESATLASANANLNEIESRIAVQQDRPTAAQNRINELRGIVDQLSGLISAETLPTENPILADARRLKAAVTRSARLAELNRLEQELLSYDVRLELLRAQRDAAQSAVVRARGRVDLMQTIVNRERQAAARSAQLLAAEAALAAANKHPALRAIAEVNLELTRELPAVASDIELATTQLADIERQSQKLEQSLSNARQRLEIGGITRATGQLFVEERRNLPRFSEYRPEVRERRRTLANIGLAQLRVEEERRGLTSIESRVDEVMQDVAADITDAEELGQIRSEANALFRERRQLLEQSASTFRTYIRILGDLDVAQRKMLDTAREYREFLDQNLIWIPNSSVTGLKTLVDMAPATAWLLSPKSWMDTTRALFGALEQNVPEAVVAFLLLAASVISQPFLKRLFRQLGSRVGRLSQDNIFVTLGSLGISALQALPLPLALALVGSALLRSSPATNFSDAVSAAFLAAAPFLYNLLLFRTLSARNGVLGRHFNWKEENLASIRRQLDRVIVIGVPIVVVTVMGYMADIPSYRHSLGRLAFVALMLLFAAVSWPLGHPRKSVGATYYAHRPNTWLSRLKWLWFSLDVGIPLFLAGLAIIGFQYTTAILTARLVDTLWLILGLVLVSLVIRRWLALARRKIEWKMALEKRDQLRAEKALKLQEGEAHEDTDEGPPVVAKKPLDLDAVDQQTRKLLQAGMLVVGIVGIWGIWSEVLPALNILDEVALWSRTITVDGVETVAPVTLADVLLAIVIAAATLIASNNLPGLMQIAVLRHLDLQPGGRYTINTLLRYAVVTVGVVSILSIIGWNWSRIQWLVAALSVGLGFGLQEIVANFVSGLIILFERPVRVGDTVTVGNLTGSVSKVRIRATTITDWDRKEIIVPNKSFITEQVVNWTLSDPITRVVIPVGISYGSDVSLAKRVMEETLAKMPLVLDDPSPHVYFVGFGDSSLNFNLYVYSRQLSDRLPLTNAVHEEILHALRANGIEIPFPQRDLHVRSVTEELRGGSGGTSKDKS